MFSDDKIKTDIDTCRHRHLYPPPPDDTSGNRSSKWNKFDSWCMTLAGLPQHMAGKPQHVHSISCSNNVSALDLAGPLVEDLLKLENGIHMYDASKGVEVLVLSPVMGLYCDNPLASKLLNHLGSSAAKFCRVCLVWQFTVYCVLCIMMQLFSIQCDRANPGEIGQLKN